MLSLLGNLGSSLGPGIEAYESKDSRSAVSCRNYVNQMIITSYAKSLVNWMKQSLEADCLFLQRKGAAGEVESGRISLGELQPANRHRLGQNKSGSNSNLPCMQLRIRRKVSPLPGRSSLFFCSSSKFPEPKSPLQEQHLKNGNKDSHNISGAARYTAASFVFSCRICPETRRTNSSERWHFPPRCQE